MVEIIGVPERWNAALDVVPRVEAPAYLPSMPGAEPAGVRRIRSLYERCPFRGSDQEMTALLMLAAGEAIAATIEILNARGVNVPMWLAGEILAETPIAIIHAVTNATATAK